jgi:hypothetical protein
MKHSDIIFVINHPYQAIMAANQDKYLTMLGKKVGYIVLHNGFNFKEIYKILNETNSEIIFDNKIYSGKSAVLRIIYYIIFAIKVKIKTSRIYAKNIIFFTELELCNHIVIRILKAKNNSVFILEDGGLASYVILGSKINYDDLTNKERFKSLIIRSLPFMRKSRPFKLNKQLFHLMKDSEINSFFCFNEVKNMRNFPVNPIQKKLEPFIMSEKPYALFLSEPLFEEYCDLNSYVNKVIKCLKILCSLNSNVWIKFHPRETEIFQRLIVKQIKLDNVNCKVCADNRPAEILLHEKAPQILASFAAAPLLYAQNSEIRVLYFFSIFDDLMEIVAFKLMKKILNEIGYEFFFLNKDQSPSSFGFKNKATKLLSIENFLNE